MGATIKTDRVATRYVAAASLAKGIVRVRRGKGFSYLYRNRLIKTATQLQRIKSLAIPPAWTDVRICPYPSGHLQAVGRDAAGRRQYIYHPSWIKKRSDKKYTRLLHFGEALPDLRNRVNNDLRAEDWSAERVIATAIRLMENSHLRIGGEQYEKDYHSHGLITLQNQHAHPGKNSLVIAYTGKKGVQQQHRITDRLLIGLIRRCRELPGKRLFQYKDEAGRRKAITTTQVNQYIKSATGENFSAKDFRTWAGTVYALNFLLHHPERADAADQNLIPEMLQYVSKHLGNTPSVCRKYYIHPRILQLYEKGGKDSRPSIKMSKQLFGKKELSALEKKLIRLLRIEKDTD